MPMHRGTRWTIAVAMLATLTACAKSSETSSPAPQDGVAVGYGEQSRDKVTGAVSSIDEKNVSAARPLRIEELLRGKVAGLRVTTNADGSVTLRLRNDARPSTAANQDPEPLIIVDGVQIQTGTLHTALAGLLPDDIKQVSVLKDVASTSIYGTRGAGGVILITTKRPKD